MNNEQQQIIDEVYKSYKEYISTALNNGYDINGGYLKQVEYGFTRLPKEEFINKCKIYEEFSKRWGLKIEERKLTWEEQVQWVMKNTDVEWENLYIVEEIAKETTPTKLITVTYKDKTIESYE